VAARTTRRYSTLPLAALVITTSARWRAASPNAKVLKTPPLLPE